MSRSRSALLAAGATLALGLGCGAVLLAGSASASTIGPERIRDYDVELVLGRDAAMQVQETIRYDFGDSVGKHGIYRTIPTAFVVDDTRERRYPISDIEVSSPSGAPADTQVDEGSTTSIRIGDEDQTVQGEQTYRIRYRVEGVVNTFSDHQELYWNVIGSEWEVPIASASARVQGPATVQRVTCFEGDRGSTQECRSSNADGTATFTASGLEPRQGMTVVAAFPTGTFPDARPIIEERQTLQRAFSLTPLTGAGALGVFAVLSGGAMALVSRHGRDERYLGLTPGLEPGAEQQGRTSRVPMVGREPVAVQFTPPEGLRPGQVGTLLDEQANVLDVTATIVDLAVRGFLRIEEVQEQRWFRDGGWKLVMVWPAPTDELHDYEMKLLKAIFDDRTEVLLSQLKQTFRADLQSVQNLLYDDVTRRGWFRGNPSSVRTRWQGFGLVLALAGAGLTWLLATRTRFGLLGVAVVLAGVLVLVLAPRMPARTAKGTALLRQTQGFRMYLEKAEAGQLRFEEGQDIFSRYLPFAIVFGVAERWAGVFEQLAASGRDVVTPTWYVGHGWGTGFSYAGFGHAMGSFTTATSGSIAAATPSSSGSSGFGGGGFSGGGGGGGGGGSW